MGMTATTPSTVRIGGASGFWGDSPLGARQLVRSGEIDYLVFDYLAETTMAILAGARLKRPELGYATDFIDVMAELLPEIQQRGIRVVANAGGMNPRGCAEALQAVALRLGLRVRVAIVAGDDVSSQWDALRAADVRDMFSHAPLPAKALSANAYLGAFPIARALDEGADIVITGRVVDSAVTLGPLIHAFGWQATDFDALAGGSLAGHIIECGCQATGGLHTDWLDVPDWPHIGYPIIDCAADGSFVLRKPAGTGGLIAPAPVAEQLLYEIGDPGAYVLPDVCCDFRAVRITALDDQRVHVSGARGRDPGHHFKVSATSLAGFRCTGTLVLVGMDAPAKARRTGEAILIRMREYLAEQGWPDFTRATVELLGAETLYGPHARAGQSREVMLRVVVQHPRKEALERFAREIAPAGTSWSPGTTGPGAGRPSVSPHILPLAFRWPKAAVVPTLDWCDTGEAWQPAPATVAVWQSSQALPMPAPALPEPAPWRAPSGEHQAVPLIRLAWARSGDKGDIANIGLVARHPHYLPLLWDYLTPERVQSYLAHLVKGPVERFHLPGIHALNFVLHEALDGGGPASTRNDPLGKAMGQLLLELPVPVPQAWGL